MPPLGMHVALARSLASEVHHPAMRLQRGAYYLGATSPDVRVLTRWERARTHFFDLDDFSEQSGVTGIFREHPKLASPDSLDESTVAFLCGYISHLEMDEAWIMDIYRPCFGERSPLKGEPLANVLDRVLQYELDRREREERPALEEIRRDLQASAVEITVGFIDQATLARWRDISANLLDQPPDWDRFSVIASRHLRAYGVASEADLAHFLRNVPDLLDQSIRQVTTERLAAFQRRSHQRALAALQEYLS